MTPRDRTKENKARTARIPSFYSIPGRSMLPTLDAVALLSRI